MILCQHGCGKPAIHITKGSLGTGPFKGAPVHQCAKSSNSCQAVKDRKVASSLAKTKGFPVSFRIEAMGRENQPGRDR